MTHDKLARLIDPLSPESVSEETTAEIERIVRESADRVGRRLTAGRHPVRAAYDLDPFCAALVSGVGAEPQASSGGTPLYAVTVSDDDGNERTVMVEAATLEQAVADATPSADPDEEAEFVISVPNVMHVGVSARGMGVAVEKALSAMNDYTLLEVDAEPSFSAYSGPVAVKRVP